jgi:apolipoprotein N-acyltransferase
VSRDEGVRGRRRVGPAGAGARPPLISNGIGFVAALLAGVAQALSFSPWELWALQVMAMGALAALLLDATPRAAAARAWAFGVGWLGGGMWWLYISLHVYGYLAAWLSVAAVALLAALLSLYYAIAAAAWARLRRGRPLADALSFAGLWLLAELARGVFFTGFPWIAGGYAHTSGPLARWAPYIGVYGIGALSAWIGAVVAFTSMSMSGSRLAWPLRFAPLLAPVVLLAIGTALPQAFTRSTGLLSVTLLQTAVAQDDKFDPPQIEKALAWHRQKLAAATGQLVLTPESSLPVLPVQIPKDLWRDYQRPFDVAGRAAMVGIFTGDDQRGYTNTVVGLDRTHHMTDGTYYHYGKRHLLPFGEFVPPGFQWMIDLMRVPIGDQARGTDTASFAVAGQRVRPLICYEDLFGEDFAAAVVGADGATVLANVSNLAWFGRRMIQDQHLQFSRMRALEFQRGQVRATNTGATAVIDYRGDVTARLPPEIVGQLDATVEGRIGDTPYAILVAKWRLWPLWALGAGAVLASLLVPRRR